MRNDEWRGFERCLSGAWQRIVTIEVVLDMFPYELPTEIIAAKIRNGVAYYFDVSVGTIKQMRSKHARNGETRTKKISSRLPRGRSSG
jgi:hypothetical protein